MTLRGAGKLATVLYLDTDHKPGLDFTGNSYRSVSDLHIMNHSGNVGVLPARTPPGANGCSGISKRIRDSWRLVCLGPESHGNRITPSERGRSIWRPWL